MIKRGSFNPAEPWRRPGSRAGGPARANWCMRVTPRAGADNHAPNFTAGSTEHDAQAPTGAPAAPRAVMGGGGGPPRVALCGSRRRERWLRAPLVHFYEPCHVRVTVCLLGRPSQGRWPRPSDASPSSKWCGLSGRGGTATTPKQCGRVAGPPVSVRVSAAESLVSSSCQLSLSLSRSVSRLRPVDPPDGTVCWSAPVTALLSPLAECPAQSRPGQSLSCDHQCRAHWHTEAVSRASCQYPESHGEPDVSRADRQYPRRLIGL